MKFFRKLGIFSFEDLIYYFATILVALYVSLILITVMHQELIGGFAYQSKFKIISLSIQFPFLLVLCISLMYLSIFAWLFMGLASIFYKKKPDIIDHDDSILISVLIPAHNEEKVIYRILQDLIKQKYRNLEIIVIAHNCTDDTIPRAQSVDDPRIRVLDVKTRKSGKALALNRGLECTKGEIIAEFDTDNRIKDEYFFNRAINYFRNPKIDVIQSSLSTSNSSDSLLCLLQEVEYDAFSSISWKGRDALGLPCFLAGTGILMRKEVLEQLNGWKNSLVEDFELFTRLVLEKKRVVYADNLVIYDEKPPSWTAIMKQRSRWIRGHLGVTWENLDKFGNWLDYIYRLSPLAVFAWWISTFLFIFYFFTNQISVLYISNWLWLGWTFIFFGFLTYTTWKKRGFKRIFLLPLYWIFGYHWVWASLFSLGVTSWRQTKTTHFGSFTNMKKGVKDEDKF
ncbi:MAG: glycosyltransferase [Candidatus Heimdallarchaeaceae archaeon]